MPPKRRDDLGFDPHGDAPVQGYDSDIAVDPYKKRKSIEFGDHTIRGDTPAPATHTVGSSPYVKSEDVGGVFTEGVMKDKPVKATPDTRKTSKDVDYVRSVSFDYQDGVRMLFEGLMADSNYKRATDQGILFDSNQRMLEFNREIRDEYLEKDRKTRLKVMGRRISLARGQARARAAAQGVRVGEGSAGAIESDVIQAGIEAQEDINTQTFINKLQNWQQTERSISQNIMSKQLTMLDAKAKYRAELFNIILKRINLGLKPRLLKNQEVTEESIPALTEGKVGVDTSLGGLSNKDKTLKQELRATKDPELIKEISGEIKANRDRMNKIVDERLEEIDKLPPGEQEAALAELFPSGESEKQVAKEPINIAEEELDLRVAGVRPRATVKSSRTSTYDGKQTPPSVEAEAEVLTDTVDPEDLGIFDDDAMAFQVQLKNETRDSYIPRENFKSEDEQVEAIGSRLGRAWYEDTGSRDKNSDKLVYFYDFLKDIYGDKMNRGKYIKMLIKDVKSVPGRKVDTKGLEKELKELLKEAETRGMLDAEEAERLPSAYDMGGY